MLPTNCLSPGVPPGNARLRADLSSTWTKECSHGDHRHANLTHKMLLRMAGFLCVLLTVAGLLLPLVPATPFALLAAACFARSSERWHRWLLEHWLFGPMVRDWEERRCVLRRIKIAAVLTMLVMGGFSVLVVVSATAGKLVGVLLMAVGCAVVLHLPDCPEDSQESGRGRSGEC